MSDCRHCGHPERLQWRAPSVWRYSCESCGASRVQESTGDPLLAVLNFSGGQQSSAIMWMLLRGEIARPSNLLVLTADPGMESSETYEYVAAMQQRCADAGIESATVPGPNLYRDLVQLRTKGASRIDNPPYWTVSEDGSQGRLKQKCTAEYKIAPMDRYIRRVLSERFGLHEENKQLGRGLVEKWIGFAADEVGRVTPSAQRYVRFAFPLIERRMTRSDVEGYFRKHGLPLPPRSVCNACFANGLDYLRKMHDERPGDWEQAVEVDEAVRDLSAVGVRDRVYVSATRLPLRELARRGFDVSDVYSDTDQFSCDSGYCFT